MSRLDDTLEPKAAGVRRVEVITGDGGRRRWSDDEKARAVEASLAPGAVISRVARAHGLTPQQLFGWRREARKRATESVDGPSFVPAVVEAPAAGRSSVEQVKAEATPARPHIIELDVHGASIWIWKGADPAMVTSIIGALKTGK